VWNMEVVVEETLEMVGTLLIAYAGIMMLNSLKNKFVLPSFKQD